MKKIMYAWLLAMMLSTQSFAAEQKKDKKPESMAVEIDALEEKKPQVSSFTLDEAINKALEKSPRMQASQSVVDAAKGSIQQAGLYTNPSIGVEAENVAGGGQYSGIDSAEITYGISQTIEIGGKRGARQNVANRELEIAGKEYLASGLDLIRDVSNAYNEAVAAKESLELVQEQRALAKDVLKTVTGRVNEAASPLIQKSRAEVEYASSAITLDKAQKRYELALKNLETLTGVPIGNLDVENFYKTTEPLKSKADKSLNPDFTKLDLSIEKAGALAELEEANAIPDPSVSLGVRDFRDTNDQAFVLGVSIPIPLFNANQGNIARARSEVTRIEADKKQAELDYSIKLANAESNMASSYVRIKTLKNDVTPSAKDAFSLAKQGYKLGRFSYMEVLDAQRSLFDVKNQYLDALKEYHASEAEIERLTAKHLDKFETKKIEVTENE